MPLRRLTHRWLIGSHGMFANQLTRAQAASATAIGPIGVVNSTAVINTTGVDSYHGGSDHTLDLGPSFPVPQ